jgi:hypothetical protein
MEGISHPFLPGAVLKPEQWKPARLLNSGSRKEQPTLENESSILDILTIEALSRSREIPRPVPEMEGITERRSGTRNVIDRFFSPLLPRRNPWFLEAHLSTELISVAYSVPRDLAHSATKAAGKFRASLRPVAWARSGCCLRHFDSPSSFRMQSAILLLPE